MNTNDTPDDIPAMTTNEKLKDVKLVEPASRPDCPVAPSDIEGEFHPCNTPLTATPRTDAEYNRILDTAFSSEQLKPMAEFARQLERELAQEQHRYSELHVTCTGLECEAAALRSAQPEPKQFPGEKGTVTVPEEVRRAMDNSVSKAIMELTHRWDSDEQQCYETIMQAIALYLAGRDTSDPGNTKVTDAQRSV